MPTIRERFKKSWNAFTGRDPTKEYYYVPPDIATGPGTSYRPDRRMKLYNVKTIVPTIYNRLAVDVANINFKHVRVDENENYKEDIDSYLNDCLFMEANIDQTGRSLLQDIAFSMFDDGVVAVVPVEADTNATNTKVNEAKIYQLRTANITQWFPAAVQVSLYNEKTGRHEDVILPKSLIAIVENPFYAIMNEPNSTLQRLVRTINKLDAFNEQNASGKLDLIIQLPYVIKSELRRKEAEKRRGEIEDQLANSKYGVAYTDGTERIVQLNRSLENNLWQQVKDLTTELYNQLGLTQSIFDGSADEQTMINYYNRTIEPICSAISEEFQRKFLTQTARSQKQRIHFIRDPFKLVPVNQLADIADKFTRNEILSSNEVRSKVGFKPVSDPRADELRNKNISRSNAELEQTPLSTDENGDMGTDTGMPTEDVSGGMDLASLGIDTGEDLQTKLDSIWKGDQNG